MLFASMSVFAQSAPKSDAAKKENLPVCCNPNKMIKAPAQQVNDKKKTIRPIKGHQDNGHSVHGKKVGHKVRVAPPGSPVSGKVEEKM